LLGIANKSIFGLLIFYGVFLKIPTIEMAHDAKQNHSQSPEEGAKSKHCNIVNVLRKISHVGVHIPYTHLEEDESAVTQERSPVSPDFTPKTIRERKISNNRAIYAKYMDGSNSSTKIENSNNSENETPLKYIEINISENEKDTTTSDPQVLSNQPKKKKKIFGGLMAAPVWTNRDKYFNDEESHPSGNSIENKIPDSIFKQIFTLKPMIGLIFVILVIVVLTWTLLSEL